MCSATPEVRRKLCFECLPSQSMRNIAQRLRGSLQLCVVEQVKRTCYAQSSQIREIRKKMTEIMTREASSCDLKELVGKFIPESIGTPVPTVSHHSASTDQLHCRKYPALVCTLSACRLAADLAVHRLSCASKCWSQLVHIKVSAPGLCLQVSMVVFVCIEQWCVSAGKDIEKQCSGIYPLQSVYVRKVKILRAPRFDVTKLMEVHGDYSEEVCKHLSAVTLLSTYCMATS